MSQGCAIVERSTAHNMLARLLTKNGTNKALETERLPYIALRTSLTMEACYHDCTTTALVRCLGSHCECGGMLAHSIMNDPWLRFIDVCNNSSAQGHAIGCPSMQQSKDLIYGNNYTLVCASILQRRLFTSTLCSYPS